MQGNFASPAQRHPLRRHHHRFPRILDRQIRILKLLHRHMQFIPLLLLRAHQHQHQIRAHGKIHRLVRDHHGVEIGLQPLQSLVNHANQIRANGVHLGVKFATHHAIAQINQAGARIPLHFAARFLQRLQDDHTARLGNRPWLPADIKNRRHTLDALVKSGAPSSLHPLDQERHRSTLLLHLRGKLLHPNRVHHFERPQLPAKSPAHRAVHFRNAVGNLRHAPRRVQTSLR